MEILKEYSLILNSEQIQIFQNIIKTQTGVIENNENLQEFLINQFYGQPYPTLQILGSLKSESIQNLIYKTFKRFIDECKFENELEISLFLNFLTNFDLPDDYMFENLLPKLHRIGDQYRKQIYLSLLTRSNPRLLNCYLEFEQKCLSSFSKKLIAWVTLKEKQHILISTLQRIHPPFDDLPKFLRNIMIIMKLIYKLNMSKCNLDNLMSFHKILSYYMVNDDNLESNNKKIQTTTQNILYYDLCRIILIMEFLKKHNPLSYHQIEIENLLETNEMLDIILRYTNLSSSSSSSSPSSSSSSSATISYDECKTIIEKNHEYLIKMQIDYKCDIELMNLSYIYTLLTIFEIIITNNRIPNYERFIDERISIIGIALRQIKDIEILNNLFEDIFKILLLRWENLNLNQNNQKFESSNKYNNTNNNLSSADTDLDTNLSNCIIISSSERYGFICRSKALQAILEFLKQFTAKRYHSEEYKNLKNDSIRNRFTLYLDEINNALWKLMLFTKLYHHDYDLLNQDYYNFFINSMDELIIYFVQSHHDSHEKSSSDDESIERYHHHHHHRGDRHHHHHHHATFSRRKSKTKRRLSMTYYQQQHQQTENVNEMKKIKNRSPIINSGDQNIIAKLLGSPENLVVAAIGNENFNEAKNIIQMFNLENSDLGKELNYLENMKKVKEKLNRIYEKYEMQIIQSANASTTIEQIKNVAAIGFESSKIINMVEKFVQFNKIQQNDDIKNLLEKYSINYPYLKQYQLNTINTVNIFDLILNSSFNSDICYNILNMTERLYCISSSSTSAPAASSSSSSTSSFQEDNNMKIYKGIGIFCVFKNFIECLRLYKSINHENMTITKILLETDYSLRPNLLIHELECEKIFHKLYSKSKSEIDNINNLKLFNTDFDKFKSKINYFQRFLIYTTNLNKLIQLKDNKTRNYTITELLEFNPISICGELIFENNMTPLEIENIIVSLNFNFVHVIAVNLCPELCKNNSFASSSSSSFSSLSSVITTTATTGSTNLNDSIAVDGIELKYQSIFNYIISNNILLGYLLQKIKGVKGYDLESSSSSSSSLLNFKYFQRAIELHETNLLKNLYNNNRSIAALISENFDYEKLLNYHQNDYRIIVEICNIFSENSKDSNKLNEIRNNTIIKSITSSSSSSYIDLIRYINDIELRSQIILENYTKIHDSQLIKDLIKCILCHKNFDSKLTEDAKDKLNLILKQVEIYSDISNVLSINSWLKIHDYSIKCPDWIMKKLLLTNEFELCYEWSIICKLIENFQNKYKLLLSLLLDSLLDIRGDQLNTYLIKLIENFPKNDVINFYVDNLQKLRNITLINYIIEYLIENNTKEDSLNIIIYKNYRISLKIFENFTSNEQEQNWNILNMPLLLLEYLIMNSKFETLSKVVDGIKSYLLENLECKFCSDKYGKSPTEMGTVINQSNKNNINSSKYFPYIPINLSFYQKDHLVTIQCFNLLLRVYATKALDYKINENYITSSSSSERVSQSTDLASLDSLYGIFIMPKTPPIKDNWIKDEDATHCMCCKRTLFTMLMRRHHCRRCGRVVCSSCSTNRMKISELYDEVLVRVCNDCVKQTEALTMKSSALQKSSVSTTTITGTSPSTIPSTSSVVKNDHEIMSESKLKSFDSQWKLNGKLSHDQLLRDEFCYEYAPSVALCLTILSFHNDDHEYIELLLFHCRKLEKLLRPNPEVDYGLVAKMINCLALAAKVRGGPPEVDVFRDHSEIILSVVRNGCETLLPTEPINNQSLRKLADALISAEKWDLALDICLKCGFQKTGVMAAHGLACLRAGCFETAREKFSYCMQSFCTEIDVSHLLMVITDDDVDTNNSSNFLSNDIVKNIPIIKRPNRSSPLLEEIINIIEFQTTLTPQPEALIRANVIRNSNTSLASNRSKRKENIPIYEPAINILNTLSNLNQIKCGNYLDKSIKSLDNQHQQQQQQQFTMKTSFIFEECLHYLLLYGTHSDIIDFLINHNQLKSALKYYVLQIANNYDIFIQNIYLHYLQIGKIEELINQMLNMDDRLLIWKDTIIHVCRYLETKNLLNSLYQLQILLKDPIRASMTCVKFYSMNCSTFYELQQNNLHLKNAQLHLENELEICQWENINIENKKKRNHQVDTTFLMIMDSKSLSARINTIRNQMEVTKFLANCEIDDNLSKRTKEILKEIRSDTPGVPTLFDSQQERIQICILILLCGKNIEEGFQLAHRLINEYKIPSIKVYGPTAKYLSRNNRLADVEKLINCLINNNNNLNSKSTTSSTNRKTNNSNSKESAIINCDEILSIVVQSTVNNHEPEVKCILDNLIKKIVNVEVKITSYIYVGQLKAAYLLAIQYNRLNDVRRILRQAEILNQSHIEKLCKKKLNISN